MASGPGFLQSGESVGEAQGPNASLEFGQATKMAQLNAQLKNAQPQAYAQGKPPDRAGQQPGGVAGTAPGPPTTGAQSPPPVQPQPRTPLSPDEVDQRVFSPPQRGQYPWRVGLAMLEMATGHPILGSLRQLAQQGLNAPNGQQQPPG